MRQVRDLDSFFPYYTRNPTKNFLVAKKRKKETALALSGDEMIDDEEKNMLPKEEEYWIYVTRTGGTGIRNLMIKVIHFTTSTGKG
jgi:hypothetical protein